MSDSDELVITFDSQADVWRVRRGDASVEISLVDMTDEYYRWQRDGSPGDDWREHVKAFCEQRLAAHLNASADRETLA